MFGKLKWEQQNQLKPRKKKMKPNQEKTFLNKLRQPIHISYISKYILKTDMDETKEILQKYIDEGIIEESNISDGYYGVKTK
jgi:hypothetical protein